MIPPRANACDAEVFVKPVDSSILNCRPRQSTKSIRARLARSRFSRSSGCQMARRAQAIRSSSCLHRLSSPAERTRAAVVFSRSPVLRRRSSYRRRHWLRFSMFGSVFAIRPNANRRLREIDRIDLNAEISDLLKRVNHDVNTAITPDGQELWLGPAEWLDDRADIWRLQRLRSDQAARPDREADCRQAPCGSRWSRPHRELDISSLSSPPRQGDIVMDNLTDAIRPWTSTSYRWLKIQSSTDARFWYEIKDPAMEANGSQIQRTFRLANR